MNGVCFGDDVFLHVFNGLGLFLLIFFHLSFFAETSNWPAWCFGGDHG